VCEAVKKVRELEPESKGHNLHVKVLELRTVLEKSKFDGTKITIGEVSHSAQNTAADSPG